MKFKNLSILMAIVAVSIILVKCTKKQEAEFGSTETQKILNVSNLSAGVNSDLSTFSKSLGIIEIQATNADSGKVNLKLTGRPVVFNGYGVDVNNEQIQLKTLVPDQVFEIVDAKRSSSMKVDLATRKAFFTIKKRKFSTDNLTKIRLRTSEKIEMYKLFIFAIELFDKDQSRKTYADWSKVERSATRFDKNNRVVANTGGGSCTRYNISFGATKSASEESAKNDEKDFLSVFTTCRKVGNVDTSCLWGDHACLSTVTFECTGAICDHGVVVE